MTTPSLDKFDSALVDQAITAMVEELQFAGSAGLPLTALTDIAEDVGGTGPRIHHLNFESAPNVYLATNLSEFAVAVFGEFQRRHRHSTDVRSTSVLVHLFEGCSVPALPEVVNGRLDYKTPHWAPLLLVWTG